MTFRRMGPKPAQTNLYALFNPRDPRLAGMVQKQFADLTPEELHVFQTLIAPLFVATKVSLTTAERGGPKTTECVVTKFDQKNSELVQQLDKASVPHAARMWLHVPPSIDDVPQLLHTRCSPTCEERESTFGHWQDVFELMSALAVAPHTLAPASSPAGTLGGRNMADGYAPYAATSPKRARGIQNPQPKRLQRGRKWDPVAPRHRDRLPPPKAKRR